MIGLLKIGALYKDTRFFSQQKPRGMLGSMTLGMAFAAGWTPCIGVTLSAVLTSAVTAGANGRGLGLMVAYSLGLSLPFIALALLLEWTGPLMRAVNRHRRVIDLASAAVLVAMGLLLITNNLALLSSGITQLVPNWPSPTL